MPKLICISDTHQQFVKNLPDGDILVHSGDWCSRGSIHELSIFVEQLKLYKKQFKHIIVIAGNHDFVAEKHPQLTKLEIESTGAIYLDDSGCEIEGLKFHGSAITPFFCNWAFNRYPDDIKKHWEMIPEDINVLITHGPPYKILDKLDEHGSLPGSHVGCPDLLKKIKTLKDLKCHIFGHIHCNGGQSRLEDGVHFINAAVLNEQYKMKQSPFIITI